MIWSLVSNAAVKLRRIKTEGIEYSWPFCGAPMTARRTVSVSRLVGIQEGSMRHENSEVRTAHLKVSESCGMKKTCL